MNKRDFSLLSAVILSVAIINSMAIKFGQLSANSTIAQMPSVAVVLGIIMSLLFVGVIAGARDLLKYNR